MNVNHPDTVYFITHNDHDKCRLVKTRPGTQRDDCQEQYFFIPHPARMSGLDK
jgi:hypothetical protein